MLPNIMWRVIKKDLYKFTGTGTGKNEIHVCRHRVQYMLLVDSLFVLTFYDHGQCLVFLVWFCVVCSSEYSISCFILKCQSLCVFRCISCLCPVSWSSAPVHNVAHLCSVTSASSLVYKLSFPNQAAAPAFGSTCSPHLNTLHVSMSGYIAFWLKSYRSIT